MVLLSFRVDRSSDDVHTRLVSPAELSSVSFVSIISQAGEMFIKHDMRDKTGSRSERCDCFGSSLWASVGSCKTFYWDRI